MAPGLRTVAARGTETTSAAGAGRVLVFSTVAILLAGVNAVAFPLWTGYPGGAAPLASSGGAYPHLALAAANAAGLLFLIWIMPWRRGIPTGYVLFLAALTRLAYLAVRTAQGVSFVDPDVNLYFRYAQEFADGRYPAMEYPQGALLLFSGAYRLASGDAGRFAIVFPLITLVFELITLAAIVGLGRRLESEQMATGLGLFYALSPFTLVLWYGKFDAVPAALLAVGAYLFIARRHYLSACALALGFLTKWFPGIALGFFVVHLLRTGKHRQAIGSAVVGAVVILLPIAYFWSLSPEKVLHTYTFHWLRPLMGESLLYIPTYLLDPAARLAPGTSPWTDTKSSLVPNNVATLVQIAGVTLALVGAALARRREAAVALAGAGVALFIILNRVFSPQYTLVLIVAYAMGLAARPVSRPVVVAVVPALLTLTLLNYLVWPLWSPFWLRASALFFALNLLLVLWLGIQAWRTEDQAATLTTTA